MVSSFLRIAPLFERIKAMQVPDRRPDSPENHGWIRARRLLGLTTVALAGFLAAHLVPARLPEAAAATPNIDPRAAHAFERFFIFDLPAGQGRFQTSLALPPGVITVIEHVSLQCLVPPGESVVARIFVDAPGPTPVVEQQIPMVQYPGLFNGQTSLVGSMETRAYATGPKIVLDITRSDNPDRQQAHGLFSVTGYATGP
jgi:hypothetical protein